MKREVQPELLDTLPLDDPRARRSRRDLCRVNAWMGNGVILARALRDSANGRVPGQILELGAGDGHLLLRVARTLAPLWPEVEVTLLDQQSLVEARTLAEYAALGWRAGIQLGDVFELIAHQSIPLDIVTTNLFLHHFPAEQLKELFGAMADRARLFVAIEPRRGAWPLFCSRLLGAIGCNAVTRHDARVSVRAGFAASELSSLWPQSAQWELSERRAGLFSHLFVAQRRS